MSLSTEVFYIHHQSGHNNKLYLPFMKKKQRFREDCQGSGLFTSMLGYFPQEGRPSASEVAWHQSSDTPFGTAKDDISSARTHQVISSVWEGCLL